MGKVIGHFRKCSSDDATECGSSCGERWRQVWMWNTMDLLGFTIDVNHSADRRWWQRRWYQEESTTERVDSSGGVQNKGAVRLLDLIKIWSDRWKNKDDVDSFFALVAQMFNI
jgi:hypothetical protein